MSKNDEKNWAPTGSLRPPTLDDHNFLMQTSIRVFLDSMENPLSLEFGHMPVNGIWFMLVGDYMHVDIIIHEAWGNA